MDRKKLFTGVSIVSLCTAIGVVGALVGCAPSQSKAESGAAEAATQEADAATMEEWGSRYPLQYGSYAEETIKSGKYEATTPSSRSCWRLPCASSAPMDRPIPSWSIHTARTTTAR
ncbi:hypothetical protein [Eggerthella sinensis]|uniref:hypothetical protein n=1 Tax=Eggerthella sinensis TaxID=242230 RepID=UPI0022E3DB6B|nr:hypothetical protein [Eggerthella sinensis]